MSWRRVRHLRVLATLRIRRRIGRRLLHLLRRWELVGQAVAIVRLRILVRHGAR
jgi:hypothetical protein